MFGNIFLIVVLSHVVWRALFKKTFFPQKKILIPMEGIQGWYGRYGRDTERFLGLFLPCCP